MGQKYKKRRVLQPIKHYYSCTLDGQRLGLVWLIFSNDQELVIGIIQDVPSDQEIVILRPSRMLDNQEIVIGVIQDASNDQVLVIGTIQNAPNDELVIGIVHDAPNYQVLVIGTIHDAPNDQVLVIGIIQDTCFIEQCFKLFCLLLLSGLYL